MKIVYEMRQSVECYRSPKNKILFLIVCYYYTISQVWVRIGVSVKYKMQLIYWIGGRFIVRLPVENFRWKTSLGLLRPMTGE